MSFIGSCIQDSARLVISSNSVSSLDLSARSTGDDSEGLQESKSVGAAKDIEDLRRMLNLGSGRRAQFENLYFR